MVLLVMLGIGRTIGRRGRISTLFQHARGFASQGAAEAKGIEGTLSKKERLSRTKLNMDMLKKLDSTGVGYLPLAVTKHLRRVNGKPNLALQKLKWMPFPFDSTGKLVKTVPQWDKTVFNSLGQEDVPQVAIIGRSNVGKSTLLNALLGFNSTFVQRAKVSDRPGETTELAFYSLGKAVEPALMLVDMPGYGFSFMNERDAARCKDLVVGYLLGSQLVERKVLKRLLLVVDARHGLKKADVDFLKDLEAAVDALRAEGLPYPKRLSWKLQVVFTKCDLVERRELCRLMSLVQGDLRTLVPAWLYSDALPAMAVSGLERQGVESLQNDIAALVPQKSAPPVQRELGQKLIFKSVDQYLRSGPDGAENGAVDAKELRRTRRERRGLRPGEGQRKPAPREEAEGRSTARGQRQGQGQKSKGNNNHSSRREGGREIDVEEGEWDDEDGNMDDERWRPKDEHSSSSAPRGKVHTGRRR